MLAEIFECLLRVRVGGVADGAYEGIDVVDADATPGLAILQDLCAFSVEAGPLVCRRTYPKA
jgi:hypothetical protein